MLEEFFASEHIGSYSSMPYSGCTVINERAALRLFGDRTPETLVMAAVPYYTKAERSNISVYAYSRDYHLYFRELSSRLSLYLQKVSPETEFVLSGDNSPIDERKAAYDCGIGFFGENGLMINEKYGTYFFLCGIYFFEKTDLEPKGLCSERECLKCGRCREMCPTGSLRERNYDICLSAVTQKKKTTEEENEIIKREGSVWGCDICQDVCPYNSSVKETEIPFFREDRVTYLDSETLDRLISQGRFSSRAFAWRGEKPVRRNIQLILGGESSGKEEQDRR